MTITRNGKSDYSWIITTPSRDPPQSSVDAGAFKRRLGRIAYDVAEQDHGSSYLKHHYVFNMMDLPPEVETRAKCNDSYRPGFKRVYNKWGHSAVHLARGEGEQSYSVKSYKIRLGPIPDADREQVVQSVAEVNPPTEKTGVWFGEVGNGPHIIVHIGSRQNCAIHPSVFLDFLADLDIESDAVAPDGGQSSL